MLPGKTYTPEDVLKILRKRFWVVVVPWAVVAAVTAAVGSQLPDRYRSMALIQVVPPQVPASIVEPVSKLRFEERLQATQQSILSRTRLERIIQDFNLYAEERQTRIMEEVVDDMRNDIAVDPVKGDAFTVSYEGRDPVTVMKVTERLAQYFKDESVREGERKAEGTSSFVEAQVAEAKRKLTDVEDRVAQYKMAHSGELPEQLQGNLQALQNIQMNLTAVAQAINTDQNAKAALERQIEAAEAQVEPPAVTTSSGADPGSGSAAHRLALAKAELANALLTKRPDHPDVKFMQNAIATLQKEADAEALRAPVATGVSVSPAEQARRTRLAAWRDDLERLKKQIAASQEYEKQLRSSAVAYQARVDRTAIRQAELMELTREYNTLSDIYNGLVATREASNMTVNLERRQIGEQFNLLDPARIPEKPFSPDRFLINLFGIVGGLLLGVGLVALLEYRDSTFKTDTELGGLINLPVLAVVPLMRSAAERRSDFRKRLLLNLGLGGTVAACGVVLAYSFLLLR